MKYPARKTANWNKNLMEMGGVWYQHLIFSMYFVFYILVD